MRFVLTQKCRSLVLQVFRGVSRLAPIVVLSLAIQSCGGGGGSNASTATAAAATVPGTPTAVTATGGNASAVVNWTAPSNGGSAITGYTVTANPGGATVIVGGGATSVTVSGLADGTSYTFTVYATNAIGNGPASTPSAAVTPATVPGMPAGVTATAGNASAVVSWTAPSSGGSAITGYTVTANPGGATANVAGGTTSATVSGLTNGSSYTFTVYATNAAGNGAASAPSAAVTPKTVPGTPTGVTATAGNASAAVSWTAPSNGGSAITGYTVTSSPGGATAIVAGGTTSATVSGLTNGTSYTFTVYATNAVGNGPVSAPSAAVTPSSGSATVPGAPTAVTAIAGNASASVSWTAPSNGGSAITGYTVTASPGGAKASVAGGTTSATVSGLTNGTPYTFTVYATNAIGNGPVSTPSPAVTPTSGNTAPGAPTGVTATAGNASATVSWTAPGNGGSTITGYTVTVNPGGATANVAGGTTSATVSGLINGSSYTFTVYATNAIGNGPTSAPSAAVTPATVPGAPTAVTATASNASAAVSWTAPSNGGSPITSYTVTASPGGATVSVAGGTTSATVSSLTNGTSYTFTVYATNAIGNGPTSTASAAVTPKTVPGAPTGVTAAAGNASAAVGWTAPGNGGSPISGYTVTANPGGATASVGGATTSATVSGLTNGTSYTFTVYATNAIGNGPNSTPSAAVTPSASAGVTIALSPARAALTITQAQQFTATVAGSTNTAVTWSVDGTPGGSATLGTVGSTGLYTPPAVAGTHTLTATSQADTTKSASSPIAVTDLAGVFTYHNDVARTGQNLQEYALTPTIVASSGAFGKLFSCSVDAAIYAQPLYVANLSIGGGIHNVVFVATENDSVYAFDADGATDSSGNCLAYWYRNFLTVGVTPVPSGDTGGGGDLPGTLGITGTPVIGGSTMYLVARFKNTSTSPVQYSEQLRALNTSTGSDVTGSPASISATVSGTAQGTSSVSFNPLTQSQRPALLLFNGFVYVAFGSAGDADPYNGWLLVYNASTLAQAQVFNSTPNGGSSSRGAFWMSGSGPAADASFIYVASANGVFDNTGNVVPPVAPSNDMGDSLLKFNSLSASSASLTVQDFFTPDNQGNDAGTDYDFGNGGVVVLPDSMGGGTSSHLHLALVSDKAGDVWLVDRDSMGRYLTGSGGTDGNVQTVYVSNSMFSTPAVWGNTLYIGAYNSPLQAYAVSNANMSTNSTRTPDTFLQLGATPSISAQATSNGIVWALDNSANGAGTSSNGFGPAILRAYDATNVATRLYASSASSADTCGMAVKFTVPTIANGKVYVGGAAGTAAGQAGQLTVYGLKP